MVGRPEYRGTASGFAYVFVKLPSFLAIFLFPALFIAIGQAAATLFVAIFALIGVLAAIFILPEVYGFEQDSEPARPRRAITASLTRLEIVGSIAAHPLDEKVLNVSLVVIVFLAFPFLWIATFADKRSFDLAVKLREVIEEILESLTEWESSKLTVIKMQAFNAYAPNLENKLGLIRGYLIIRFVAGLPRKKNIRAACAILPEFYRCIWYDPPELRYRAQVLAIELKRLLK